MIDHSPETSLSPDERNFIDLMQNGDDFFKIELFRPAKNCYRKALGLNFETEKVRQKIAECDRLLAFEIKVFRILAVIIAVIVLACFIFR